MHCNVHVFYKMIFGNKSRINPYFWPAMMARILNADPTVWLDGVIPPQVSQFMRLMYLKFDKHRQKNID